MCAADLTVDDDVAQLFEQARAKFGDVTVLVNNAAPTDLVGPSNMDGRLTDVPIDKFRRILDVGLVSAYSCCYHAIPMMQRAGRGSIVNVSSVAGVKATPRVFSYATAKGGLQALTRSVAADYYRDGIRANTVIVGFVVSNPLAEKWANDPAMSKAMKGSQMTPIAYPDDVATVIRFLASAESGFINGSEIYADGGATVKHVIPGTKAEARSDRDGDCALRRHTDDLAQTGFAVNQAVGASAHQARTILNVGGAPAVCHRYDSFTYGGVGKRDGLDRTVAGGDCYRRSMVDAFTPHVVGVHVRGARLKFGRNTSMF